MLYTQMSSTAHNTPKFKIDTPLVTVRAIITNAPQMIVALLAFSNVSHTHIVHSVLTYISATHMDGRHYYLQNAGSSREISIKQPIVEFTPLCNTSRVTLEAVAFLEDRSRNIQTLSAEQLMTVEVEFPCKSLTNNPETVRGGSTL